MPEAYNTMKSGATAGVKRLNITKENWVGGPNAQLGRITDWVDEKIMTESMR
jgi:hypothetical protein